MAIQKIDEIYINGVKGMFAGGYIYSMKMDRGYSESPSKVTISIVLDSSTTKSFSIPSTSIGTSYSIKVGSITLPRMYFISYSTSISVGQKTLNCDFIDESFQLDRVFVGLTNRHYPAQGSEQVSWAVQANCLSCASADLVSVPASVIQTRQTLGLGGKNADSFGSLIVVGDEEFVEGSCDVPDVKYAFNDLKKVFPIKLLNFPSNSQIKQNYTGTLREVLSNWVSDFGGTFSYNPFLCQLEYISLTEPSNLDNIKNYIESNFNSNSSLAISSYEYSETMEGTYSQRVGTFFLKPSRTTTSDFTYYSPITLECKKVFGANYSSDEVITSVLSLYDARLRTIYLSFMLNSSGEDFAYGCRKLGLQVISNLNTEGVFNLGIATLRDIYNKNPGGKFILAYANQGTADNYLEKDRALAESVGKNYELRNFPIGTRGVYGNLVAYAGQKIEYCTGSDTKVSISYETYPSIQTSSAGSYYGTFQRSSATYDPAPGEIVFFGDIENYLPSYMEVEGEVFSKLIDAGTLNVNSNINGLKIIYIPPGSKKQVASIAVGGGANSREEGLSQEVPQTEGDCLGTCTNFVDKICEQYACDGTKAYPPVKGLGQDTQGISIVILNVIVHLPYQSDYLGYLKTTESITKTRPGVRQINPGNLSTSNEAMSLKYISYDTTSATSYEQSIASDIITPGPADYDATQKPQSISVKIIGLNFGDLINYAYSSSPIMDSFNISIDENGLFSDFSFKTRPISLPEKEEVMQRVTPQKITITK